MPLPVVIQNACAALRHQPWSDAHEAMSPDDIMKTALGVLIRSFEGSSSGETQRRLAWLSFFAARRVLPCWDFYCDGDQPQRAVEALGQWLMASVSPKSWQPYLEPALPVYKGKRIVDCRECDTGCAASAVAHAIRYAFRHELFDAVCALSAAVAAFDQSPLQNHDEFCRWVLEVAVPAAYECRELTLPEQSAFRTYDPKAIRLKGQEHV